MKGTICIFKMERKVISSFDIIILLSVIVLGIVGIFIFEKNKDKGQMVSISVEGDVVYNIIIPSTPKDKVIIAIKDGQATEITEEKMKSLVDEYDLQRNDKNMPDLNIVVIERGETFVAEANCPDKICVNHSEIGNVGESIICLPHKLIVEIREK